MIASQRSTGAQGACQSSAIVCENQLAGSPPSEWDITGAGDPSIQGFTTDISTDKGDTVRFKISTDAASFRMDIYRLGYYGGLGARKVTTIENVAGVQQPPCLTDPRGLIDCGNWSESLALPVPTDAVSGIYIAKLTRPDTGGASHIAFIVRDDESRSDLLFQTSDTTWQAYNTYGGNSLYVGGPGTNPSRAYAVSYNRPITTRATSPRDWLFNAEYPMVRWLEGNGFDVSYASGIDTDRRGAAALQRHRVFLSVGHDEYWSAGQRAHVEAARDSGVHLAFFSGNEVYWKTRWEPSIDGSATPYRTLVSYKESSANAVIDPEDPPIWTGLWRDGRFSPPADGGRPENALTGTIFTVNCCTFGASMRVPYSLAAAPFWRNTWIAALAPGETATLPAGTLGYEWDEDLDNGSRPAGLVRLSSATYQVGQKLTNTFTFAPGVATHSMTLYPAPSGSLVFSAGSVQYSWGLDGRHDVVSSEPDIGMQQATLNLFADMGVEPQTLLPGLAAAVPLDVMPPTIVAIAPIDGAVEVPVSSVVAVTFSEPIAPASLVPGAIVLTGPNLVPVPAAITYDGGTRTATLRPEAPLNLGTTYTVTVRKGTGGAQDLSGNAMANDVGWSFTTSSCPCTIWPESAAVGGMDPESIPLEVGVKFQSDVAGAITGLRFYKHPGNSGEHVGHLWTAGGALLGSVVFGNETASGWQQADFSTPTPIAAHTTYVASYSTNTGHYASTEFGLVTAVDNGPLHALASGASSGNGVASPGAPGTFPALSWNASNYWVDVVFGAAIDTEPPTVTEKLPADGGSNVAVTEAVTATFSEAMLAASVTPATVLLSDAGGGPVNAGVVYDQAARRAVLTPVTPLAYATTYNATIRGGASGVKDAVGNALIGDVTWTFTTEPAPSSCPCTIWSASAAVGGMDPESIPLEVGVKFQSDLAGAITGLRFYKHPGNSGEHVGHLWSASGALLGSVAFANETESGWQQANVATPIPIAAHTTYVASYSTTTGHYASTEWGLVNAVDSGPLHALANGADGGGNGVAAPGAPGTFPALTWNASNYWVDVVFMPAPSPPGP